MRLYPNCKVNIGLHITGKRHDGYHTLDTIFYPIYNLSDILDIDHAPTLSFSCDGIAVDCNSDDNLVMRCYRLMQQRYPQIGPVAIRLTKRIPFGAGLGGGSSDAAHTALALNRLFNLGLSREQLAAEVEPLGADCPFFIYNVPCHATGTGEILTPVEDEWNHLYIVLVKPDIAISTREAYAGIDSLGNLIFRPGFNDFELSVFPQHPRLELIKQTLLDHGAVYASLSGSGATVFGLFSSPITDINSLFADCFVCATTLSPQPHAAV